MPTSGAGILCLILIISAAIPSLATVYTVGDSAGWAIGVDYGSWPSGKTFAVGDSLVFNYPSGHTVDEVTSSDYGTCTVGNAIKSDSSGATTIPLQTPGMRYFICGIPGHCAGGMKLSVNVTGPASTTPVTTPSGSNSSPPSSTTTSPVTPTTTLTPPAATETLPSSSGTISPIAAVFITLVSMVYILVVP